MLKQKILTIAAVLAVNFVFAQVPDSLEVNTAGDTIPRDTSWKKGGLISINFSQVALGNWAAGGQNSISGTGLLSAFANYKKDKITWDNQLDLGFGVINQGRSGWVKSDDKIDFFSKVGRQAINDWFYAAALTFKSQFAQGFNDPYLPDTSRQLISNFFAPAYLIIALGMDYKPNENFNVFISPATAKVTWVMDQTLADAGAFGVTGADLDTAGAIIPGTGENMRVEMGGSLKSLYKVSLMENVSLMLKLELFSNYLNNPGNIDVNGELLLGLKVNKYISVTVNALVLYDDDINIARDTNDDGIIDKNGPVTQWKEVLGVGVNFKF